MDLEVDQILLERRQCATCHRPFKVRPVSRIQYCCNNCEYMSGTRRRGWRNVEKPARAIHRIGAH